MNPILNHLGTRLARFLSRTNPNYQPLATSTPDALAAAIKPGDVLLVEGNTRFSTAIKFLTQSTWSHAALYVGNVSEKQSTLEGQLIEADVVEGVIAAPLSKYAGMHTRICRPIDLTYEDRQRVIDFARERIGHHYDLKHIFDLVRYLLPQPPIPTPWRRRMLALGSSDPTRAICSTLIAQAFQSVRYPILPITLLQQAPRGNRNAVIKEVMQLRHHSLFTPRDFDISPYFAVVKPTLVSHFDYRKIVWQELD